MRQDSFDPNSLLDSFHAKVAASQRKIDLGHILDGWQADPTGAGLRQDSARAPQPQPQPVFTPTTRWRADVTDVTDVIDIGDISEVLDAARTAEADQVIDLAEVTDQIDLREVARATDDQPDTSDLDAVCAPAAHVAAEAAAAADWAAPVLAEWQPPRDPRLLTHWRPGAWIGSFKPVCEAVTEFITTPHGTAVETYPPQMLLALWAPKAGAAGEGPIIGRWPDKALLGVVPSTGVESSAARSLVEHLPADATVWIGEVDPDWALVAELVMHHEPTLRPFQLKALRGIAEAERLAVFEQLNNGYAQPEPGRPVQIKR
jgi:hypothetical protein